MAVGTRTGRCYISEGSPTVSGQERQLLLHSPNRWWQLCLKQLYLPPTEEEVYAIARNVLSVCLLTRLLKNACMNLDEILHVDRPMSGHGRTDQLLSPIRIIVQMPEPENLKVEGMSKLVKQAPHSELATDHGMHCREILFTPRCSPRAREFPRSVDLRLRSYGASNLPNFRILVFVGGTCAPPSALLVWTIY